MVELELSVDVQKKAEFVCKIIKEHPNSECFVVGGAVRDTILGKKPKDIDFATNLKPSEVAETITKDGQCKLVPLEANDSVKEGGPENIYLFKGTGIEHGTVRFVCDKYPKEVFEMTTFRKDVYDEGKSHRPKEVIFTSSIVEDVKRRDLTINAMSYDPLKKKLFDPFNGAKDLLNKYIRAVGDADKRIIEDPLREMRACRFKAILGGEMDPELVKAIRNHRKLIHNISAERISEELEKGLKKSKKPSKFIQCLDETGLLEEILPEVSDLRGIPQPPEHHRYDVYTHTLKVLDNAKQTDNGDNFELLLAALLHDTGKKIAYEANKEAIIGSVETGKKVPFFPKHEIYSSEIATEVSRRLRLSNKTTKTVTELVRYHMLFPTYHLQKTQKFASKFQEKFKDKKELIGFLNKLFDLNLSDVKGTGIDNEQNRETLRQIESMRQRVNTELSKKVLTMKDLPLRGGEIIQILRVPPGPIIGQLQKELFNEFLHRDGKMDREEAIEFIDRKYIELVTLMDY